MAHLVDRATLYLWQCTIYTKLAIDLKYQVLLCVVFVAHQCYVTLQVFTQDVSYACNIIDDNRQNPPKMVWHASWILHLKIRTKRNLILVKPCGHLNHVQLASVANERALTPFVRDEVLLPKNIQYGRCKSRVKHVALSSPPLWILVVTTVFT